MMEKVKKKWNDLMAEGTVSKLEQRMWALVVGIGLTFGGIWLQNQYSTTLKLQEQLAEYMKFVDDKYVEESSFNQHTVVLERRLDRIEDKLDNIIENDHRILGPGGSSAPGTGR